MMNDLKRSLILVFSLPLLVSFDWYDNICEKIERTYVMTSLSFHGFKCSTKTLSDCSYSQCEGKIGDYPKPVFITVPQEIDSLGLHFHGHLLGSVTSKPYDGPPAEMIKNFGVENSLCKSKQLTVIPTSTGANADYLDYFKDSPNYTQFMENIQKTLGGSLRNAPLHLSGHSGGGKYVAGSLDAGIATARVSVYDGIYSEKTKKSLKSWYLKTGAPLTVVTVKGMPPEDFVAKKPDGLRAELGVSQTASNLKIKGVNYEVFKKGNFTHLSRDAYPVTHNQAHFDVVNHVWPRELQAR